MFKKHNIVCLFVLLAILECFSCTSAMGQQIDDDVLRARDSLDRITIPMPTLKEIHYEKTIVVKTQEQWAALCKSLKSELDRGLRNIEIKVAGKGLVMPVNPNTILNLNYPDANVRVVNANAEFFPEGVVLQRNGKYVVREGAFWVCPYTDGDIEDIFVDNNWNEISLFSEVNIISNPIERVKVDSKEFWRMRMELPDLNIEECRDFYVLVSRNWTSARHRVRNVKDGWLYFYLESKDSYGDCDPNIDSRLYGVSPRVILINSPVSKGLHIKNGKTYVPWRYKTIRIVKGGYLLHLSGCSFNSFEVTGFKLKGLRNCPIGVFNCTFNEGLFVHHNSFSQIASLAFSTVNCNNICFSDNTITNARGRIIGFSGTNFTICRNQVKNVGWMFNTVAISGGGENLHICDNVIEDFNYGAIGCGSRAATRDSVKLTYIIERNLIRHSDQFIQNYFHNTLADGGAIYIGPSCTQGIIRNNVIQNIKGINGNRGIFLDDGAKNLAIYGNLVMNTANYYDIDLRLVNAFEKDIPDHNTNNSLFQNILTGGYRFEDTGKDRSCFGGHNLLLGLGAYQITTVSLTRNPVDKTLDGCYYSRGKVVIPKKYSHDLIEAGADSFVMKYIVTK